MSNSLLSDHHSSSAEVLQRVMQQAKIPSQRALAEKAKVSRWQVKQLHQGKIDTMRLAVLKKLAAALNYSLTELLQIFAPELTLLDNMTEAPQNVSNGDVSISRVNEEITLLRQEYARLEQRLEQQSQQLQQQYQAEALRLIESWLTYWPTAAKAATERDGFDAKKLLPLVKPIERLVESWGVTAIGNVGDHLAYDPQQHQLARGMANPGDLVRISHLGYRHGDNLLQRAKVVPVNP